MTHPAANSLLDWYAETARDLPWRKTTEPYAIWVAEIMLQQTRVETVIPYFQRWMTSFPSIESLAKASTEQVLRSWEGLGYYRRAHNLHKAAVEVMDQWDGQLPKTIEDLKSLPGIGDYTAAAIAVFAYNIDAIALDGNLRRVFARVLDLEIDPRLPEGERRVLSLASDWLPNGQASNFNQSLMDLGATVCQPGNPSCGDCPLKRWCLAYEHGTQPIRPIRKPKSPIPHYYAAAGVLQDAGKVLIGRRPEDKLLGGLWEFPGGKQDSGESLTACLKRELKEELGINAHIGEKIGTFDHAYTHFKITVHAYFVDLISGTPKPLDHVELAWVEPHQFLGYPMGKVDRAISRKVTELLS